MCTDLDKRRCSEMPTDLGRQKIWCIYYTVIERYIAIIIVHFIITSHGHSYTYWRWRTSGLTLKLYCSSMLLSGLSPGSGAVDI